MTSTDTAVSMGKAALWYATNGIQVFPLHYPKGGRCSCGRPNCENQGKHPLTPHGFLDATTDPAKVMEWWSQWPNANIGVPTGAASGFLVVDCDPRNGGPVDREEFIRRFGPIPHTPEVITGGGGRHLYFRYSGAVPKTLAEGIDLKGEGGYAVAPPSLHASGRRYEVDGLEGAKAFLKVAEPPPWLSKYISAPQNRTRTEPVAEGTKWGPGDRNNKLASEAGSMRRRGLPGEAIEAALIKINEMQCDPPLPDAEVRQIAESVSRYEPAVDNRVNGVASAGAEEGGSAPRFGANWPDPPKEEAYYGLAGEWVHLVEPRTEADPAALLMQFLVALGNLVGRGPHFRVEADQHYTNLFTVVVGQTAKGRKGTSLGQVQDLLRSIDQEWCTARVTTGLSSGEGLIWAVRDEIREHTPIRERGRVVGYEGVVTDPGVSDKRLLVTEPEYASVLQRAERETNTLSAVIRQAWDSGNLRTLTKRQSACATNAHISLIGHITRDELRRTLSSTEAGNGYANRFLWLCARRSKCLPEGGAMHTVDLGPIIRGVKTAVEFSRGVGEIQRDEQARAIWRQVYPELSEGKPGLFGAVTSRAEAQVLRLSCLYALLDTSPVVRAEHLIAALALWEYCEASARFIFGDALGDVTADEILRALRARPEGMTRTDLRDHFGRNKHSSEIDRALSLLQEYGRARMVKATGGGRPVERWHAV